MANNKQQMKRNLTNEKRRVLNMSFKSSVKSAIKAVEDAAQKGNVEEAKVAYNFVNKKLDKAVTKGILHKNAAARHKSSLSSLINKMA